MRLAIIALIIILAINLIGGLYYNLYKFPWFDATLHFSGGVFVALLFSQYLKPHFRPNSKMANMLIIVGATMLIGVVWEFTEYTADHIIKPPLRAAYGPKVPNFMGDLDDTISDLLLDTLGAMFLAGLFVGIRKKTS